MDNNNLADISRGCEFCRDETGETILPMYGVAPHECYWRKGHEYTIGQSTLLPFDQWTDAFVPDLDLDETWDDFAYPGACGTYWCPRCDAAAYSAHWNRLVDRIGPPPASGMSPGTAEAKQRAQGEAGQPGPQGATQGPSS